MAHPHILRPPGCRGVRLLLLAAGEGRATLLPVAAQYPYELTHAIISWNFRSVGSVSAREVT